MADFRVLFRDSILVLFRDFLCFVFIRITHCRWFEEIDRERERRESERKKNQPRREKRRKDAAAADDDDEKKRNQTNICTVKI